MNTKLKITGISGSLRAHSSNTNILHQLGALLTPDANFKIYDGLGNLPHFNPELDTPTPPESVGIFRQQLRSSDAIIICTPEYAFGVPGSLKNALDWTVSTGDLDQKPLALITASLSGEKGHAALLNTLTALSVNISYDCKILVPFIRAKLDAKGFVNDPAVLELFDAMIRSLVRTCRAQPEPGANG